ncbi:unnamed protein product [Fraxinus pennsylvanica]|uniref:Protein kinase domain-containing protein n=1 Tax=Fraxinus pennsylvanica TaxID=56036 RepID=A0AAD2A4G1_9LAMI|nr:unnamed protein product [Fraxinus pennsylvanica]
MQSICFVLLLLVKIAVGKLDTDALVEIKKGIQKDPLGKVLDSWDPKSLASDGCPKDWFGISCIDGQVISITLNDLGLVGEFSFTAISGLQMLRNLSISNNQFSGIISKEVGLIESLASFDLSRNLFTGSIPSQLTSLKNLVLLNLSSNNLAGEIPSGFTGFELLKHLDLHSNDFSGNVMDLLAQLGGVMYVDLSSNNFWGSLDLGIGTSDFVSSIQYLNISHNNLTGELFPHDGMPYFDSLEVFDASNNHFVGNVPSFTFIVSLRVIKLSNNQLSGSLPQGLLQDSSMVLSELDLSLNQIEGPVGSITSGNLKNLNLSCNRLSGPLPARVGHCSVIDLSNNMFTGNFSKIRSWGNYVEVIALSSNALTGALPNQTTQFLRLTSLKISNNSLEGVIPPILGTYPELKDIDFSLNQLNGFLLPSLFNSTKLTTINLSFNNFTGTIPIQALINQNYSLESLDLSHNALTGNLSPELGKFQNMVHLDLSNNHLEGDIPDDLPGTLRGFNVSYNNLSGVVPKNLERFPGSAFHPGNSLLMLQNEASSPKIGPNLSFGRHRSRTKSAIRAALIACLVAGASVIALLTLMIYCRTHRARGERTTSKDTSVKKDLSSSQIESGSHPQAISSAIRGSKDQNLPESTSKSAMSAADSSPSKIQHLSENPSTLKVCSPDKLAGDLHLFDDSLRFTAEELSSAPAEVIGMSCHGTLYKAVLGSGHELAVRWLKQGIAKGRNEFAREAKKLGNIRHPNLVSLQGFYWGPEEHEKLIISNYINAPCLALYLHETDPRTLPPLSLNERLKIALDVARCLSYLHNESAIPHGNLKSTNILIEISNVNALLTDYSLHRLLTSTGTAEQVLNAGALGYMPPEFTSTSKPCPSLKSDVYAFGVILLELLTGKNSAEIVPCEPEVMDLTEWARLLAAENRSVKCFDQQIVETRNTEHPLKILDTLLQIALKCILPAAERPDMKMVYEDLSSIGR